MRLFILAAAVLLNSGAASAANNPDFPQTGSGSGGQNGASASSGGGSSSGASAQTDFSPPAGNSNSSRGGSGSSGPGFSRTNPNVNLDQSGAGSNGGQAVSPADKAKAEGDGGQASAAAAMSLEDARVNFETVVQAYVAKKTVNGYWVYRDKSGKSRRLKALSVDSDGVEKTGENNRFSGAGILRDSHGGRLTLLFTVDFSGTDWKVIAVKPAPPKPAKSQ